MPKICPVYFQDMPKICTGYAQDMPSICTRYAQDISKICPGYAQDMPRICTGYAQDMPRIFPRYDQGMPRIPRQITTQSDSVTCTVLEMIPHLIDSQLFHRLIQIALYDKLWTSRRTFWKISFPTLPFLRNKKTSCQLGWSDNIEYWPKAQLLFMPSECDTSAPGGPGVNSSAARAATNSRQRTDGSTLKPHKSEFKN